MISGEDGTQEWRDFMVTMSDRLDYWFRGSESTDEKLEAVVRWIQQYVLTKGHVDVNKQITEFGIKCDREFNPDPHVWRIVTTVTCNLDNGDECKGIKYIITGSGCSADWADRRPETVSRDGINPGGGTPYFDPIAAYERAMGILDTR